MGNYIGGTGLTYLWGKIKSYIVSAISGKADKVSSPTSGNFASLDSNGNLEDSGHKHSDYLTEHQSLANYVTLNGTQNITGEKTFVGTKRVKFKQSGSSDKIGFTCYNSSSAESGNFEADPANKAINLGIYSPDTAPSTDWLVGFKYQAKDSAGTVHKFGLRVPSRFGNSTYAEHYIPVQINSKEADNTGAITLSASDVGALPSSTVIPSAPGTLNTTATTAQSTSSSEALSGSITLHKVSKTGSYNDLLNKPTIPTVPTNVSAFTNDAGYLTSHQDISGKADKVSSATNGDLAGLDANGNLTDSGVASADIVKFSPDNGTGIVPEDGIRVETVLSGATISVNPDVVTVISGAVGTAAITLQVPSDSLAHVWDILMTTDSTVSITFAMSDSTTIKVPSGFTSPSASKSVEISVIGTGTTYYLRYGEFA